MSQLANNIEVQNLNHLGIIAGIIDEIGIVDIINEQLGIQPQEKLNSGIIVKSIILNAMGFVSRPLYLFPQFFNDKATEHLFGEGILPEDFNRLLAEVRGKGKGEGKKPDFLFLCPLTFNLFPKLNRSLSDLCKSSNDDKIARVMDKLYQFGLTKIFLLIALTALKKYGIDNKYSHKEFYINLFARRLCYLSNCNVRKFRACTYQNSSRIFKR